MSRAIIQLTLIVLTLINASLAFANNSALKEVTNYEEQTLNRLLSPTVSKSEKLMAIQKNKNLIEERLKELIIDGRVKPTDLSNPESDLSKAFEVVDQLTILSHLKIVGSQVSQEGCIDAQAMIAVAGTNSILEAKTMQILQGLCK